MLFLSITRKCCDLTPERAENSGAVPVESVAAASPKIPSTQAGGKIGQKTSGSRRFPKPRRQDLPKLPSLRNKGSLKSSSDRGQELVTTFDQESRFSDQVSLRLWHCHNVPHPCVVTEEAKTTVPSCPLKELVLPLILVPHFVSELRTAVIYDL